jgi:hypothetical protein
MERPDPKTIGEKYIDIKKILAAKHVKLPKFIIRLTERLLHVPDLNKGIYMNREFFGLYTNFLKGKTLRTSA